MPGSTLAAEIPQHTETQPLEARWITMDCCPACGSGSSTHCGLLPDRRYAFGSESVPLPASGIAVKRCNACELVYKSTLPAPAFLARLFQGHAADKWKSLHDFAGEVATLRRLNGSDTFDVLDVGAAAGALLKACIAHGVRGRRSALDVMRYPGIEAHLAGEFIAGFLDQPALEWQREPYGVVTLFDVLEHLYEPRVAFGNLRTMVGRNGLVFVETGDTESFWPRHFGAHHWWYVRLIEHHVFWSRRSLQAIAAAHGFEIVMWKAVRHKSRRDLLPGGTLSDLLKVALYWLAPGHYRTLAEWLGKHGNQPWYPYAHDHVQVCLRRT